MQIKLKFSNGKSKVFHVKKDSTIEDLLKEIGVNIETVIVKMNGKIVPEVEKLEDNCTLELIEFVSSG
ncbi:MAG: MoaD/ThiS family protein [Candidatus Aenigmarchaeota archaeon]|nr:MoaD/ThiS family protein [Candidatus Aenigmarchaeota archaeon]